MSKKLSQNITYWLGVVAIGLVVGLSLQFVRAWTEPAVAPPGGNVGAPINTGNIGQWKLGNLALNTNGTYANGLIVANGNVGIGTPGPGRRLHVVSSADDIVRFESSNAAEGILDISNIGEGGIRISTDGSGPLRFRTAAPAGEDQVVINTNGKVGIGTTAPTYRLSVGTQNNPSIASPNNPFNVADAGDLIVTGGVDSLWALYDKDMHTIIGWDANNDHMGIAGGSEPAYTLRVHGSIA